ncbi:MAG: HD domain-containing phosphohydrolase [Actinomycetota bacterium]
MSQQRLRVLVVGGDASTWVGLTSSLGELNPQLFVPKEGADVAFMVEHQEIEIVVLVCNPDDADGTKASIEMLKSSGLEPRTIMLAAPEDRVAVSGALEAGVAGYVLRGSAPEQLGLAITQVSRGGVFFDAPAAALLRAVAPAISGLPGMAVARALASALELKDTYTGGHAERVTALALRLARDAALDDAPVGDDLEIAFLLHDVGKIGIPESILGKPGGLTDTERRVLETHPILGERIVAPLGLARCVRQVIRHHHERWDGRGYPDRLSGYEIPSCARIFAIADVIDAMTSVRPYRRPVSFEQAMLEIEAGAGKHFDPDLCALAREAFVDVPIDLLDSSVGLDL